MKKVYMSFVLLLFCSLHYLYAQDTYITTGNSVKISSNEYQLTKDFWQAGTVWNQTQVDLNKCFTIQTQLYFGNIDQQGADGIAFVLQQKNVDQGGVGERIGYDGITPSFAVEFDTWQNPAPYRNDPPEDHIGFMKNGSATHTSGQYPSHTTSTTGGYFTLPNIELGKWYDAVFSWNGINKTLAVSFMDSTYTYSGDIAASIFSGSSNVYWGFTSATGGGMNDQRVRVLSVSNNVSQVAVTIADAFALNKGVKPNTVYTGYDPASSITLTAQASGGSGLYTYKWSTGETTQSIKVSPTATTTYTVTVTDSKGCNQPSAQKTITVVDVSCDKNDKKDHKVQICQVPQGNSSNAHTICVDEHAVATHLDNGDYLGACTNDPNSTNDNTENKLSCNILPNPSNNYFTIVTKCVSNDPVTIKVYELLTGKLVEAKTNITPNGTIMLGQNYRSGMYSLEVTQGKESITTKLIKN